ncbi:MAG: hypothetical protein U0350_05020 [Caldilineaceae bacterium]
MNQPFDDTAKTFYRRFFENLGMQAIPQYEVFARSRSIDLIVACNDEDRNKLQTTCFAHFRRFNALEFKGYHDPLTAANFNLIMMRAWGLGIIDDEDRPAATAASTHALRLYSAEIAEKPSQRTVTIVCVTRPLKLLETLQHEFHFEPTREPGVYCNNERGISVWIIHPTELALKPANYVLLPLARGKKLELFLELCMQQGLLDYVQLTLDIGLVTDPDVIWRKLLEVYKMELTIHEDTWPYIDEFFRNVPEALHKLPTLQEVLAENARIAERRGERRGELHSQQQTLMLILRHKFGMLPDHVGKVIEATDNEELLKKWLEQALDADSLAEIKFPPPSQNE